MPHQTDSLVAQTFSQQLQDLQDACLQITTAGVQALNALHTNQPSERDATLLWTCASLQDQVGALGTLSEVVSACRSTLLTALQNAQVEEAAVNRRIRLMEIKIAEAEKVPLSSLKKLLSDLGHSTTPGDPEETLDFLTKEDKARIDRSQVLHDLEKQSAKLADELNKLQQMESKLLPTFEPIFKQYETHANVNFGGVA